MDNAVAVEQQLDIGNGGILIEFVSENNRDTLLKVAATYESFLFRNWSTSYDATGELQLECSFFNENVSAWEPLLEPVRVSEGIYRPYTLSFRLLMVGTFLS